MSQEHADAIPADLQGVRRTPDATGPRRYWKSLDELADAPAFLEFLHREFPEQASMFEDPKGRREFMTLMGASLALADQRADLVVGASGDPPPGGGYATQPLGGMRFVFAMAPSHPLAQVTYEYTSPP